MYTGSPLLLTISYYVSQSIYLFSAAVVILTAKREGMKQGIYSIAILVLAGAISIMLKDVFRLPRPAGSVPDTIGRYGFPSTHTSVSFAGASLLNSRILYLWASLIALSRIVLGVHHIHDIVGGLLLGLLLGTAARAYQKDICGVLNEKQVFEIRRKTFHIIFGALTGAMIYLLPELTVISILLLILFSSILSSIFVKQGVRIPLLSWVIGLFEREQDLEYMPMKGSIFFTSGALCSVIVFSREIASASVLILAFGDGAATIVGVTAGRTKHLHNIKKSLEGSISGLIAGFFGAALLLPSGLAFAGALAGTIIESFDLRVGHLAIDDNLLIPVTCGAVMTLLPALIHW